MTQTKTPPLRFPEFKGEWEEKKLGDITSWKSGGTPSKNNPSFWGGDIPWISASSMIGNQYEDSDLKITEEGLKKGSTLAKRGSLLLLVRGSMLFNKIPIGITLRDVAFNQDVKALKVDSAFLTDFIFQYILSKENQIKYLVTGTGIGAGKLDTDTLKNITLKLPTLPEQEKIASFLTVVDKRIALLTQKKAQLAQYKKGVMQQLFSQQIRFTQANGTPYPDWEEKKLGEVFDFFATNSLSRSNLNYDSGEVKNIHYGDIHTKFNSNFDILKEDVPYINSDFDLNKVKPESYLKEGDVVMADASEDYADIGKSIEVINLEGQKVVAGLHTYILRGKQELAIGFSGYLMQDWNIRLQIMKIATGISVLGISKTNLSKIEFHLPSLPEQQKIAAFLSGIDARIATVTQQITQTQTWKQGLLQGMFV